MPTARTPARSLLALSLAAAAGGAFAQATPPQYHLEPIVIPGATNVYVADMNNDGLVVGYYTDENYENQPFLWDGTQATTLPIPSDRVGGQATGVNNLGQIVGYASVILEDGAENTALVWDTADLANYVVITAPAGTDPLPDAINDLGEVVGFAATDGQFNAFQWSATTGFIDDGVPPYGLGAQAYWSDINNLGAKVGGWYFATAPMNHATYGQNGEAGIVPIAAGVNDTASRALAINDAGVAVGEMDTDFDGEVEAVAFVEGEVRPIPGAGLGLARSLASDINADGVIVGRAMDFATFAFKAFVFVDGESYDIAAQADNGDSYEYLLNAVTVNDDGVIAGTARGPDFSVVSFVARPVVDEEPPLEPHVFSDGFEG